MEEGCQKDGTGCFLFQEDYRWPRDCVVEGDRGFEVGLPLSQVNEPHAELRDPPSLRTHGLIQAGTVVYGVIVRFQLLRFHCVIAMVSKPGLVIWSIYELSCTPFYGYLCLMVHSPPVLGEP